jgi:predicted N-acyltransferase
VVCKKLKGSDISTEQWDFFYQCYENTYHQHRSTPYLTREFFYTLGERMPQNVLLIIAEQAGEPIAAAFNIYGDSALYGRYWGAVRYVPGLHFELCYYQAQEFCIAQGIRYFEGGAQGEHKLARGFKPRPTRSFHKIAHPDFEAAIKSFVQHEAKGMDAYQDELEERAPFRRINY